MPRRHHCDDLSLPPDRVLLSIVLRKHPKSCPCGVTFEFGTLVCAQHCRGLQCTSALSRVRCDFREQQSLMHVQRLSLHALFTHIKLMYSSVPRQKQWHKSCPRRVPMDALMDGLRSEVNWSQSAVVRSAVVGSEVLGGDSRDPRPRTLCDVQLRTPPREVECNRCQMHCTPLMSRSEETEQEVIWPL